MRKEIRIMYVCDPKQEKGLYVAGDFDEVEKNKCSLFR